MAIIVSFPARMLTWNAIGPSYIVMLKIEDETLGEINAYIIKEYSRYLEFMVN